MQKTITRVMQLFEQEDNFFKVSDKRIESWCELLKGIDRECILHAAWALISDKDVKDIRVGMVRNMALTIQAGQLDTATAVEAWGDVLRKIQRKDVTLSELTKKALANVKSIDDLRRLDDLTWDRSWFEKSYNAELKKEIRKRNIPPAVLGLAAANRQLLPAKVEYPAKYNPVPYQPITEPETEPETEPNGWEGYTDEERAAAIRWQCAGLAGEIGDL